MSEARLVAVLRSADAIDRAAGLDAYAAYHDTLAQLAAHYDAPFAGTVAAFCALSPNNDYVGNLRSTVSLLVARQSGLPLDAVNVSTYTACKRRAWAYLHGADFLAATTGPKTRAFYQNILDPADPGPVTIDGHMFAIWTGRHLTMKQAVQARLPYRLVADAVRWVARMEGLVPNQVQGICWYAWRRRHGVKTPMQLDCFTHPAGLRPDITTLRPWFASRSA